MQIGVYLTEPQSSFCMTEFQQRCLTLAQFLIIRTEVLRAYQPISRRYNQDSIVRSYNPISSKRTER